MTQDVDIQLQVWKDLAISKQILMGAATDALGLDAECSIDELKAALNQAIQRAKDADDNIVEIRNQTDRLIDEMEHQLSEAELARQQAEEKVEDALEASELAGRQLSSGKSDNAEALRKAKAEVANKQNKLKAISKALADTPENVVKKLKTLKKQKLDEAKLRGQAESRLQSMRKEKSKLESELKTQNSVTALAGSLVEQLRELHQLCKQANKTIKKLSENKKDQLKIPKLDAEALESLEKALEK